jgi:hypothetical protein
MERSSFKVTSEGLSHGGDTHGKRFAGGGVITLDRTRSRRIAVVEYNVSSSR